MAEKAVEYQKYTKKLTRQFWDSNPCGLSSSWAESVRIRYSYTDTYLFNYLTCDYFGDKSVLEIGCGQGMDASEIVKYAKSYVGVDISGQSLAIAKRENSNLSNSRATPPQFLNSDAEHLEFSNNSFDVVYSIGVLHHTPGFDRAIKEIHRVMKSDGTLILMLYHKYTPLWLVMEGVRAPFRLPVIGKRMREYVLKRLRDKKSREADSLTGTVLIELIGSPIIDTYSYGELERYFEGFFSIQQYNAYRVGFDQVVRLLPSQLNSAWPQERIAAIDDFLGRRFGFYQVLVAKKL